MNQGGGKIYKQDIIFPELSYQIVKVIYDVHNQIGGGCSENYYQKAVSIGLKNAGFKFEEQYYVPLKFQDQVIGKYYLDFLVENKIVLELKRGRYVPKNIYFQANKYLEALDLRLALIACFAMDCAVIKRIINQRI